MLISLYVMAQNIKRSLTIGISVDAPMKGESFPTAKHRRTCLLLLMFSRKPIWVWSTHAHRTASHAKRKKPHTMRLCLYTARTRKKKSRVVVEIATAMLHFMAVSKPAQRAVSVVTIRSLMVSGGVGGTALTNKAQGHNAENQARYSSAFACKY